MWHTFQSKHGMGPGPSRLLEKADPMPTFTMLVKISFLINLKIAIYLKIDISFFQNYQNKATFVKNLIFFNIRFCI